MPIFKKIYRLERAQYAFLDHFRDVIKIEILQAGNGTAHALVSISSHFARASSNSREVEAYFSQLRRKVYLSVVILMEMRFNLWYPPLF